MIQFPLYNSTDQVACSKKENPRKEENGASHLSFPGA